jgi:hypothetical protein
MDYDPETRRFLEEARKVQQRAKEERFARLGCRLWASALTLTVLCWIAAVWLDSGQLGATGAILLIPVVVGGVLHAIWSPEDSDK